MFLLTHFHATCKGHYSDFSYTTVDAMRCDGVPQEFYSRDSQLHHTAETGSHLLPSLRLLPASILLLHQL